MRIFVWGEGTNLQGCLHRELQDLYELPDEPGYGVTLPSEVSRRLSADRVVIYNGTPEELSKVADELLTPTEYTRRVAQTLREAIKESKA